MSKKLKQLFSQLLLLAELLPVIAILGLVLLFLIPIPRSILDILLATNLLLSLAILFRAFSLKSPLEFPSFPRIILLTTLLRLGLNISSTRLILAQGETGTRAAGKVIEAFGTLIIQGEIIVGVVVFAAVAIINFLVIAKGSGRIAEVSARFSLDALPGKQMALEGDVRSGAIRPEEAEVKRRALLEESRFYGAMDGAMKFVQGDAIAAIILVLLNAFGGLGIASAKGVAWSEAFDVYGTLAIGEGLISILPSLFISVSAGLLVTQASDENARSVIFSHAVTLRSFVLAALVGILLAVSTLFPVIPFLFGSVVLCGATFIF
jgi:flagellar biosynthesis protein FlhA